MDAPVEPPQKISPLERYQVFRNRIEHEDNLIMQRLSWLMASQSFLFTAYAIVTNGMSTSSTTGGNIFVNHLQTLARIIPVVALLNSLLILVSILAALKAVRELRHGYQRQPEPFDLIPLQTSKSARMLGLSAPVLLPMLFLAVWLFLLIH
jgi:ABC-type transport system involved in Fe-S cluster assembly fused permease/ATPase subunit